MSIELGRDAERVCPPCMGGKQMYGGDRVRIYYVIKEMGSPLDGSGKMGFRNLDSWKT